MLQGWGVDRGGEGARGREGERKGGEGGNFERTHVVEDDTYSFLENHTNVSFNFNSNFSQKPQMRGGSMHSFIISSISQAQVRSEKGKGKTRAGT